MTPVALMTGISEPRDCADSLAVACDSMSEAAPSASTGRPGASPVDSQRLSERLRRLAQRGHRLLVPVLLLERRNSRALPQLFDGGDDSGVGHRDILGGPEVPEGA